MDRDSAGANPLSPAKIKPITSSCLVASPKQWSLSSLCKPSFDPIRVVPSELKLAEGTHVSLTQTVEMLSSRILYLEDLVESYRKELAGVTDLKISLRVKEIECSDLVSNLHTFIFDFVSIRENSRKLNHNSNTPIDSAHKYFCP